MVRDRHRGRVNASTGKMIVTVRQLEDLHKRNGSNGHVTLPYRARLTPLAHDWLRHRNIKLDHADADSTAPSPIAVAAQPSLAVSQPTAPSQPGSSLWWCDGP